MVVQLLTLDELLNIKKPLLTQDGGATKGQGVYGCIKATVAIVTEDFVTIECVIFT
jgi:hypothetical protein